MDQPNYSDQFKSVYSRGANDGFIFGIYLSLMVLSLFHSVAGPSAFCGIASLLLIVAVPVVIYFFLRRSYRAAGCRSQFSSLWLHGICIFFFGSLLLALTTYIYMRFVNPAFIPQMLETARQSYIELNTPDAQSIAAMIEQIQKAKAYPTAAAVAVELIWLAVFTGSLLSMLLSLVVRALNRPPHTPPPMG